MGISKLKISAGLDMHYSRVVNMSFPFAVTSLEVRRSEAAFVAIAGILVYGGTFRLLGEAASDQ